MTKYTKELLEPLIKESVTWAEVCRTLGLKPATGAQSHLKSVAAKFHLDWSHFVGQSWSKGREFPHTRKPLDIYLIKDGPFIKSHDLKKRLIREGIKQKRCEQCSCSSWLDKDLPLELDHINADHYDNRLENLMILCPNCHAVKTRAQRRIPK